MLYFLTPKALVVRSISHRLHILLLICNKLTKVERSSTASSNSSWWPTGVTCIHNKGMISFLALFPHIFPLNEWINSLNDRVMNTQVITPYATKGKLYIYIGIVIIKQISSMCDGVAI